MVREDLLAAQREVLLKAHGYNQQMSFE